MNTLTAHAGLFDDLGAALRGVTQKETSTINTAPQNNAPVAQHLKTEQGRNLAVTSHDSANKRNDAKTTTEHAEIFVQLGHTSIVRAVAVSPDGRFVLSGSADKTLKLLETESKRELRTMIGHSQPITAAAFSPDGRILVSSSLDELKLWDTSNGRELKTIKESGVTSIFKALAISPDGRFIVTGGSEFSGGGFSGFRRGASLRLWDATSGRNLKTLMKPLGMDDSEVNAVAFSPDGRTIVSGGFTIVSGYREIALKIWDASSGRELKSLTGHNKIITAVAFSPDGHTVVSGSADKTLRFWDTSSGQELRTIIADGDEINDGEAYGGIGGVTSVAFSPNGKTIVAGNFHKELKLWDVATGQELQSMEHRVVQAVAFSANGRTIISGGADNMIKLWDTASGKERTYQRAQGHQVNSVAISPDGRTMVSSGQKLFGMKPVGTLNLWDATNGEKLQTLGRNVDYSVPRPLSETDIVAFSPDGHTIVSTDYDVLTLWDAVSRRELRAIKGHGCRISTVAFSPDGRTIVSGCKGLSKTIELWDVVSGRQLKALKSNNIVTSVAFSPDGRTMVSGGNSPLKLWDVASGEELPTLINHGNFVGAVAFSPDGRIIVSSGATASSMGSIDLNLKLWDSANGKELRTLSWYNKIEFSDDRATAIVFSPDGRTIATLHNDTIRLWDVDNGKELRTLSAHAIQLTSVAFSPDGKNIISGGRDGTVHQWDFKTGREVAQFASFSNGEWVTITTEGYYNSSANGHKNLNVRMGNEIHGIDQFYDVFYRPDIVQASLKGDDTSGLITLTIDDAIQSPPPTVVFTTIPQYTDLAKIRVCYKVVSTGGGIGEVRLFQNGKLVKSDGFYRQSVANVFDEKLNIASLNSATIQRDLRNLKVVQNTISPIISTDKGNEFEECQELETLPGENEISVAAFNATNTIQSSLETASFKVDRKPEDPHLYVLGVGIDHYSDSSVDLHYATKDANDFKAMIQKKANGLYKAESIHIEGLSDSAANKEGIQKAIEVLSAKVKPWDSFILFVASHGVLLENQYYIVTAGYDGTMNHANMISSNEIVGISKNIKSLSQLFIFDTCHAGGVDNLISGLYDARMSVMAKKMGLHIYASAGSTQTAMDGYKGNGLFTYTLLQSMQESKTTDTNQDQEVSVAELGGQARVETMAISKKLGDPQSPNIINFGRDNALFMVKEAVIQPAQQAANDPAVIVAPAKTIKSSTQKSVKANSAK